MVRPQYREGKWRLGRVEEQILSHILPYISNRFPVTRDSQLPTKREGNVRRSLGQIFNPITFWPRLVYTKPCAITAFLVRS
jgi:hypothetical protein